MVVTLSLGEFNLTWSCTRPADQDAADRRLDDSYASMRLEVGVGLHLSSLS